MRIFCMALVLGCSVAPALADPTGDWFVEKELSVIRVQPCGQAMCGTIGWTKTPDIDKHNPDPAKRDQPMVGVQILRSMKPAGENRWEGEIYNPKDGKTYSGNIALSGANTLEIEGCVLRVLCGGQTWTRAKCDEPSPSPAAGGKRPPADKGARKGAPAATSGAAASFVPLTGCRAVAP
jgi:uncharacterized protein (DUF2147 family)